MCDETDLGQNKYAIVLKELQTAGLSIDTRNAGSWVSFFHSFFFLRRVPFIESAAESARFFKTDVLLHVRIDHDRRFSSLFLFFFSFIAFSLAFLLFFSHFFSFFCTPFSLISIS